MSPPPTSSARSRRDPVRRRVSTGRSGTWPARASGAVRGWADGGPRPAHGRRCRPSCGRGRHRRPRRCASCRAVIGLATGSSPLGLYAELAAAVRAGSLDLGRRPRLRARRVRRAAGRSPAVLPRGAAARGVRTPGAPARPAARAGRLRARRGCARRRCGRVRATHRRGRRGRRADPRHRGQRPPRLQRAGLGAVVATRVKRLSDRTRRDNARFFDGIDDVPTHCVTQGLGTVLDARRLVLVASGPGQGRRRSRPRSRARCRRRARHRCSSGTPTRPPCSTRPPPRACATGTTTTPRPPACERSPATAAYAAPRRRVARGLWTTHRGRELVLHSPWTGICAGHRARAGCGSAARAHSCPHRLSTPVDGVSSGAVHRLSTGSVAIRGLPDWCPAGGAPTVGRVLSAGPTGGRRRQGTVGTALFTGVDRGCTACHSSLRGRGARVARPS